MVLVTGALLGLNLRSPSCGHCHGFYGANGIKSLCTARFYGWPRRCLAWTEELAVPTEHDEEMRVLRDHLYRMPDGALIPVDDPECPAFGLFDMRWPAALLDIGVALAILAGVAVICERRARRRSAPATPAGEAAG
ncbi:MAG: hypothetical protein NTW87_08550 [Planctomycetota bacterium]|nr:hypothetical protein [Planctomycetota bacterium]